MATIPISKADILAALGEFIYQNSPTDTIGLEIEIDLLFHQRAGACPLCSDANDPEVIGQTYSHSHGHTISTGMRDLRRTPFPKPNARSHAHKGANHEEQAQRQADA